MSVIVRLKAVFGHKVSCRCCRKNCSKKTIHKEHKRRRERILHRCANTKWQLLFCIYSKALMNKPFIKQRKRKKGGNKWTRIRSRSKGHTCVTCPCSLDDVQEGVPSLSCPSGQWILQSALAAPLSSSYWDVLLPTFRAIVENKAPVHDAAMPSHREHKHSDRHGVPSVRSDCFQIPSFSETDLLAAEQNDAQVTACLWKAQTSAKQHIATTNAKLHRATNVSTITARKWCGRTEKKWAKPAAGERRCIPSFRKKGASISTKIRQGVLCIHACYYCAHRHFRHVQRRLSMGNLMTIKETQGRQTNWEQKIKNKIIK